MSQSKDELMYIEIKVPSNLGADRKVAYLHKQLNKTYVFTVPDGKLPGDIYKQPLFVPFITPKQFRLPKLVHTDATLVGSFAAVDIEATVQSYGGYQQMKKLKTIEINKLKTRFVNVDLDCTYSTFDNSQQVAIASYRWDNDKDHRSANILKLLLKCVRAKIKFLYLDQVSIDQNQEGIISKVVTFSTMYAKLPIITAYKEKDIDRCWILSEIAQFAHHNGFKALVDDKSMRSIFGLRNLLVLLSRIGFDSTLNPLPMFRKNKLHPFMALPLGYRLFWGLGQLLLTPLIILLDIIFLVLELVLFSWFGDRFGISVNVKRWFLNIPWIILWVTCIDKIYLRALLSVPSMTRYQRVKVRQDHLMDGKKSRKSSNVESLQLVRPLIQSITTKKEPCTFYGDAIHVMLTQSMTPFARNYFDRVAKGVLVPGRSLGKGRGDCPKCRVRAAVILMIANLPDTSISLTVNGLFSDGHKVFAPLTNAFRDGFPQHCQRTSHAMGILPWGSSVYELNKFFTFEQANRNFRAIHYMVVGNAGTLSLDSNIGISYGFSDWHLKKTNRVTKNDYPLLLHYAFIDMLACECNDTV